MQAKNRKHYCVAVFMDVEKAFDKVWHDGLIYVLIKYNIPIIFIRFIKSFLTNRYTHFKINNIMSELIKILNGLPQGSCLSTILFIIYVANIPKPKTKPAFISQFADDIKTYNTAKHLKPLHKNIQETLNNIKNFCNEHRITLNSKKTKELIIKQKNTHSNNRHHTTKLTKHSNNHNKT